MNSDLGIEKKKTQDLKNSFEEKLKILNEKLNEKEQDIKYLKTENLKSQNFYDENLKTLKAQEEKKLEKFEESIQQLTEGLKEQLFSVDFNFKIYIEPSGLRLDGFLVP